MPGKNDETVPENVEGWDVPADTATPAPQKEQAASLQLVL